MRAAIWLLTGVLIVVGRGWVRAAEPGDHDDFHLVLMASQHPVFIRLEAQADGAGLRGMRARYGQKLFRSYDADNDGFLSREEAVNVPPLIKATGMRETFSLVDTWVSVDAAPADDRVSLAELVDYIDRVFGDPLQVTVRSQRAAQQIDLFALLDIDRDGRLSQPELRQAPFSLRKLDADDDGAFTLDELSGMAGNLNPGGVQAVPAAESVDVPLLPLVGGTGIAAGAARLVERYRATGTNAGGLNAEQLGVSGAAFAAADRNSDGLADVGELTQWLSNPEPRVVLRLQLYKAKRGKPQWSVIADGGGLARESKGKVTLLVDGVVVELGIGQSRGNSSDARNFFRTRFRQLDSDKNQYLNEQEFAQLNGDFLTNGLPNVTFKMVDINGDGMVTDPELSAFIDQDSSAQQGRLELVISHDGESVFEILGGKGSQRLSPRNLLMGVRTLEKHDRDQDGTISPTEMVGKFRMQAELGTPGMFRTGTRMLPMPLASPRQDVSGGGPVWFQKMDRNRDGDVSRREFLGPRDRFIKLDVDGDGLLSAREAAGAGGSSSAVPDAGAAAAPDTTVVKPSP